MTSSYLDMDDVTDREATNDTTTAPSVRNTELHISSNDEETQPPSTPQTTAIESAAEYELNISTEDMLIPPHLLSIRPKSLYGSTGELSRDSTVGTSNTKRDDGSSTMVTSSLQQQFSQIESVISHCTDSRSQSTSESDDGCEFSSSEQQKENSQLGHEFSTTASSGASVSRKHKQDQHMLLDPSAVLNFAMEYRIFLKAALNLLTELDRTAPELGMMDPIVLKAGSIKKASHLMNGVWKVKYVEIRRGMLSYYENAVSNVSGSRMVNGDPQGELLRKNIPLEASTCKCRAVKLHQKALNFSPSGAIFELTTTGNTSNSNTGSTIKRLWMATSREERQAWMHAINNAMVGGSVTRGDCLVDHSGIVRTVSGRSPFKNDLRKYLKQQSSLRSAKTPTEYLTGLRELLNHKLHIPVEWIRKQGMLSSDSNAGNGSLSSNLAFQESTVEMSVDQLWRDLQRDSVSINGVVYRGDSSHGPERIFGALTRSIMSTARKSGTTGTQSDLRESKALVYSRDILLAGNRTRSGGDSYFCVDALCSNLDLVVVVPSGIEVEPVEILITEDDSDESLHNRFYDKSDWIRTKSKLQRGWRRHFVVLSEGMLSYYEGATPRPHGLRGQQVLADATISISKVSSKQSSNLIEANHNEFIVSISLKEGNTKDRLLLFESETKLLDWVFALECVTKAKPSTDAVRKSLRRRLSSPENEQQGTSSSMTTIFNGAQQATLEHAVKLKLDPELVQKRLMNLELRATCGVRVSVSACTEYKVCTTNPQGDEDQDTWAVIQAHFLQAFRIYGGATGRIMRGEEVVRFSVLNCLDPSPHLATEGPLSPSTSMRSRINRRIFRNPSVDHDIVEGGPFGAVADGLVARAASAT
jgi:PH domain